MAEASAWTVGIVREAARGYAVVDKARRRGGGESRVLVRRTRERATTFLQSAPRGETSAV